MASAMTHELIKALSKFQALVGNPETNKEVSMQGRAKYTYADMACIREHTRKALAECDLALVHQLVPDMGGLAVFSTLRHVSDQWMASLWPLQLGGKPQEVAAQRTYGCRYNTLGLLNLAAEDDPDGDPTTDHGPKHPAKPPMQPAQTKAAQAPKAAATPKPALTKPQPAADPEHRSPEEMQALHKVAAASKWKAEQVLGYMGAAFKVTQPQRLSPDQYAQIMRVVADQSPESAMQRLQDAKNARVMTDGDGAL